MGTGGNAKGERIRKALLDPQRSTARLWPGANTHNRSLPSKRAALFVLRLPFQCSVLSKDFTKYGPPLFPHSCRSLGGVAEGLDLTYTTTNDIHALTPSPLCSLFLAIHLLGITPKDGVNPLLLDAELGQRLFYKFIPVSNYGFGIGFGGR